MTHIGRKNKLLCILISIVTALILVGCSARVADLSVISTKNIDLSENIQLNANIANRYSGEDCNFFLLNYYPLFNEIPNLEVAVDKALDKGNGNIMVDEVTVVSDVWVIIGNIKCIQATGAVLYVPPNQPIEVDRSYQYNRETSQYNQETNKNLDARFKQEMQK